MTRTASTLVLDRSRPFGTIFGDDKHGAQFEQDGHKFKGDGSCCYENKQAIQAKLLQAEQEAQEKQARLEQVRAEAAALEAELGIEPAAPPPPPPPPTVNTVPADTQTPNPGTPVTPPAAAAQTDTLEGLLRKLHPQKVKQRVTDAGLTPATGAGSNEKNIQMLLGAAAAAS